VGDAIWSAADADLGGVVQDALAGMGLPATDPVEVVVKRVPAAYPVYDLGFSESFETLLAWAEAIPGLLTFGRHGLFAHNNSHHALDMGWAAAGALGSDGTFDAETWASSVAGFASHVVED
jgi:protoporphyrinogen oxidase